MAAAAGVLPGQHLGRTGGIVIRTRLELVTDQEPLTLGQGLGVGVNHPQIAHIHGLGGQQAVIHRHARLADHL